LFSVHHERITSNGPVSFVNHDSNRSPDLPAPTKRQIRSNLRDGEPTPTHIYAVDPNSNPECYRASKYLCIRTYSKFYRTSEKPPLALRLLSSILSVRLLLRPSARPIIIPACVLIGAAVEPAPTGKLADPWR
jgi:hypothetical protein